MDRTNDSAYSRGSRRQFVLSAAALFAASRLRGRQEEPTFSTGVRVVNVLATVRNRRGEIVRNLARDDFQLAENGRPQAIRYFSQESDLPLTVGLLVDTSISQQRVMNAERGACSRFVDEVLRDNRDRVFLVQFDMAVHIDLGLTSSRRELDDALAFLDTPTFNELRNQSGGGTLLYDAIETAAKDIMKNQEGRKALIVLSDGVDTGSDVTVRAAIEAAERADTLVYSVLFADTGFYGLGGRSGRHILESISRQTGGGFFEVSKKQGIDQVFQIIQEELRSEYNLGYVSDVPVRISEFRRIQLSAKQKGLIVQARDRYWARR